MSFRMHGIFFLRKMFSSTVRHNIYSLTPFKMFVMSVHMPAVMNLLSGEAYCHGQTCIFISISSSFVTFNRLWVHPSSTSMFSGEIYSGPHTIHSQRWKENTRQASHPATNYGASKCSVGPKQDDC